MKFELGENIFEIGDEVSVSNRFAKVVEVKSRLLGIRKNGSEFRVIEGYIVEQFVDGMTRRVECYKNQIKEW